MKSLLVVTHINFWHGGAGHRARLRSIIDFLSRSMTITVAYAGRFSQQDETILRQSYPDITVEVLDNRADFVFKNCAKRFETFISDKTYDLILVEYIEMAFVAPYLKGKGVTMLDTHDLVTERIRSFEAAGAKHTGFSLTEAEESEIFGWFDYVIGIQHHDVKKIQAIVGPSRTLYIPHAISFEQQRLRDEVHNIGFVASEYAPNVEAMNWFVDNCWPVLRRRGQFTLNIYGNVCLRVRDEVARDSSIILHHFVPDLRLVYEQSDIMINPVRFGAGLKIKNVEALANGLPLVTTLHGASGMEEEINRSFIVAETSHEFIAAITRLADDKPWRLSLGCHAYEYAQRNFSPEQCYKPFIEIARK